RVPTRPAVITCAGPRASPSPPAPVAFFRRAPPPTATSTLSLHDALPICLPPQPPQLARRCAGELPAGHDNRAGRRPVEACEHARSEEHTSELQSRRDLVCRLLLEKKKTASAAAK